MVNIRPLEQQHAAALTQLIGEQPLNPFLQSWAWGDFQRAIGRKIWRLGAWDGPTLVGAALVVEHQLLLGKTYLYCPRGPVATSLAVWQELLGALRKLGASSGAMYVKADPGLYHWSLSADLFPREYSIGTTLQPQQTLVLDVGQDPASLIERTHQKTRYNIRLAEKKGVAVRWSTKREDLGKFLQLMHHTAARQAIRLHSDQYYQTMFDVLSTLGLVELAVGEFAGQAAAVNLVVWHGQTATYLHGGSSDKHKEVMAPHLVQWRTIERAHQRGVKDYDLWGVAPADLPDHKWAGISRFKRGFGGREVVLPPAANAVLQPQWYLAYRLAKRMRGGRDE